MGQLITQAEYARRRGVSREAVRKAIADGRVRGIPHGTKVMVDPEVADIQWARNTDVDQQQRGAPGQFELTQQRAQEAMRGTAEETPQTSAPTPAAQGEGESPLLVQEKTETERIRRQLLELDLAEKQSLLVRKDDVERAYASKLAGARDALEGLPDRLADELAALTDAVQIHARLSEEIRLAMRSLLIEAPAGIN
jgi:hypothetical protein